LSDSFGLSDNLQNRNSFSARLRTIFEMKGLHDKNHPHQIAVLPVSENTKTKIRSFCIRTALFLFFRGGILTE